MMDWGKASLILSLALSVAAFVRSYGEDRGAAKEWKKMVEDTLTRLAAHVDNDEAHWTPRERDGLQRQLDRIEELVRDLLTPRSSNTIGRNTHANDEG
jgi:hypothetical protein